jgi:PIN domain nuclease of toxin-antitoxin system
MGGGHLSLLLDTHAFLWWLGGNKRLPIAIRRMIEIEPTVWVSAASAWEICIKVRTGKLPEAAAIVDDVLGAALSQGFRPLAMEFVDAEQAGRLRSKHKDPFDRMLAVQALREKCVLISADTVFDHMGVERIWR